MSPAPLSARVLLDTDLFPLFRQRFEYRGTNIHLLLGWFPAQGDTIDALDLYDYIGPSSVAHSLRELLGKPIDHRVVREVERLRRHGRVAAFQAVRVHLRKVEGFQVRRELFASLLDVDQATPAAVGFLRRHQPVRTHFNRIRRTEASFIEPACCQQHRVVNGFRIEANQRHPRDQGSIGIGLRNRRRSRPTVADRPNSSPSADASP